MYFQHYFTHLETFFRRCKSVNSVLVHFKAGTRNYRARSDIFHKFWWEILAEVLSVMKSPRDAVRNENNMLWCKEASIKNTVQLKLSSSNNSFWWCFLTFSKMSSIHRTTVTLVFLLLSCYDALIKPYRHAEVVSGTI